MIKLRRLTALLLIPTISFCNTVEEGEASWYGKQHHGKHTASSTIKRPVIFDMNKMTAAHRTLPFGTKILVTNIKNGKSCVLVVNDRGPYTKKKSRILDVSYAASKVLGFSGTAKVRIELR